MISANTLHPIFFKTNLVDCCNLDELCFEISKMSEPAPGKYNGEQLRTVGVPAYLSQEFPNDYQRFAQRDNLKLIKRFSALYQEAFRVLSSYFNENIYISIRASAPGFHVIRVNDEFPAYSGGVPHVDSSYLHVPAFLDRRDSNEHYSFTLLLSEVAPDIGLECWGENVSESDASGKNPEKFFQYQRGKILLFSSNLVHRIAPFESKTDRVTLQGHLIRFENRLLAYW